MRQGLVAILNQYFAQIRIRTNKMKVLYCVLEDDLVGVCTKLYRAPEEFFHIGGFVRASMDKADSSRR